MTRQRWLVVGLGLMIGIGSARGAQANPPPESVTYSDGDVGRRLVEYLQAAAAEGFSGAVLAAKDGQVVAAIGVGSADLEGKIPNTPATLFEIASATKQFTAAAVMRLVQDGRLALDDSIAKHLPNVPENCRAITIEHLLRHTSGIPGSNAQGGGDDIDAVLPSFLRGGPLHPPGTHWEYWNQGYAILSEIISRAAGKPYTQYCKEALFVPAGMSRTCFTGDQAPEEAVVAIGRSARGGGGGPARSALEHPYGSYGFQYRGMGGAVSTVWDLWRWDRALHGEAILNEETKAKLFAPGLGDYALGWFVKQDARGRLVQSHGGGVRGFICGIRRYPAEDAFLVVLCNRDDAPLRRVMQAAEEILFGDPPTDPKPLTRLDAELQRALTGRYEDDRGTSLVIEADARAGEGTTRARIHWSPPSGPVTNATLGLDEKGELRLNDGSPQALPLAFTQGKDGKVASVTIIGRVFQRVGDQREAGKPAGAAGAAGGDDDLPIDPGMNVMIATRPYQLNQHGLAHLPAGLTWTVLPGYVGSRPDGQQVRDDRITLVIQDPANSFWPVIVRMDTDVAEKLVRELQAMIESREVKR